MRGEDIKTQIYQALQKSPLKDQVQRLSLFGSYACGEASEKSDVDLLVEFFPSSKIGFFALAEMQQSIESFLMKKVDLLTPDALSPYLRSAVLDQAQLIYEK